MKKPKEVILMAGLVALTATAILAAPPNAPRAGRGQGPMEERLGLSAEQANQIHQLRTEFQKARVKQRAEIEVARLELRELMRAPALDDKAVTAKAKLLGDLEAVQVRQRIEHQLAMAKLLTPEQRAKARDLMFEQGGRGGPGRAGCPYGRPCRSERGRGFGHGGHRPAVGPGDVAAE